MLMQDEGRVMTLDVRTMSPGDSPRHVHVGAVAGGERPFILPALVRTCPLARGLHPYRIREELVISGLCEMQAPLVSIFEALLVASRKGICLIPNVLVHKPEFFCEQQDGFQHIERPHAIVHVLLDVDNERTRRFECLNPNPDNREHPVRILIFRDATVGFLSLLRKRRGCHDQVRKLPSLFVQLGQDGQAVPVNDAVEFHSQLILASLGNHQSRAAPAESGLHWAVRMMRTIANIPSNPRPKTREH